MTEHVTSELLAFSSFNNVETNMKLDINIVEHPTQSSLLFPKQALVFSVQVF